MEITLLGLSYRTASLEIREKLYISPDQAADFLNRLQSVAPEAILFSTCNRFEILTAGEVQSSSIAEIISQNCNLTRDQFEHLLYEYKGEEAVDHVFRVAASLDSMIVGEAQILGQMKHFFTIAQEHKTTGPSLHALMEHAFAVAKKVRTETRIASNPVSVPSVAVDLASKVFGNIQEKTAFIIGAGKMGLLALQHLRSRGVHKFLITNRTLSTAAELANQINGRAIPFEEFTTYLSEADIVIGSSGSPDFVIRTEHVGRAMAQRRNRPLFLIDIAVPRDMDPQIHKISNVFLYDVDDLQHVSEKNREDRMKEAAAAERIVNQEARTFWSRLQSLDVNPTIREIHQGVEEICKRELAHTFSRMGSMTQDQQKKIETMVSRLANKILQCPFSELRQLAAQPGSIDKIDFIGRLFQFK
jgi:glutamyl-tRNA reductase